MSPDFPNLKEAFNRAVTRVTLERIKLYQGDLGKIRRGQISEGSSLAIVREDGNEEPLALTRASSALTISLDELKDFGLQQLFERLDQIALDMARQQSEHFYKTMSEGAQSAGTAIDAGGQRFTPELYFRTLETMWIAFNSDGSPEIPKLHCSPGAEAEIRSVFEQIERTPELKARFNEIIMKKREEANARAANRILVG
jgi:hypothetical protein